MFLYVTFKLLSFNGVRLYINLGAALTLLARGLIVCMENIDPRWTVSSII